VGSDVRKTQLASLISVPTFVDPAHMSQIASSADLPERCITSDLEGLPFDPSRRTTRCGERSMMIRLPMVALMLLSGAGALAQPATTKLDAVSGIPPIDNKTQAEDLKFRSDADNRLTVTVHVSGSGPYRFLVDTGADRTAVSSQIAARLNLPSAGRAQLHSVTGVSGVSTARVDNLQFTRLVELPIDAVVLDGQNMGADGIVGVDLLRSQRVQLDFATNTMTIVPSDTPDFASEPGSIVITGRRKNGRLIVTDAEANGQKLTVVLDTGSEVSIGNDALRRRLIGRGLVDPSRTVELQSVTGAKIQGDYMVIREMKLGGIDLNNLVVVFADAHTFSQLKLNNRPALLLGMNAIRAFKKVSIDFANRKFRVVLPEQSLADTRLAYRSN
jgi:predicted aspartyl protease